jgi:hypothetical protein
MSKDSTYEVKTVKAMIPMCHKCASRLAQLVSRDPDCSEIIGCKELTRKEWDDGNKKGEEGFFFQHNCPIDKGVENGKA